MIRTQAGQFKARSFFTNAEEALGFGSITVKKDRGMRVNTLESPDSSGGPFPKKTGIKYSLLATNQPSSTTPPYVAYLWLKTTSLNQYQNPNQPSGPWVDTGGFPIYGNSVYKVTEANPLIQFIPNSSISVSESRNINGVLNYTGTRQRVFYEAFYRGIPIEYVDVTDPFYLPTEETFFYRGIDIGVLTLNWKKKKFTNSIYGFLPPSPPPVVTISYSDDQVIIGYAGAPVEVGFIPSPYIPAPTPPAGQIGISNQSVTIQSRLAIGPVADW